VSGGRRRGVSVAGEELVGVAAPVPFAESDVQLVDGAGEFEGGVLDGGGRADVFEFHEAAEAGDGVDGDLDGVVEGPGVAGFVHGDQLWEVQRGEELADGVAVGDGGLEFVAVGLFGRAEWQPPFEVEGRDAVLVTDAEPLRDDVVGEEVAVRRVVVGVYLPGLAVPGGAGFLQSGAQQVGVGDAVLAFDFGCTSQCGFSIRLVIGARGQCH